MELLLNLVWLALTLGAIARCAVWAAGEPDRRRILPVALATVCVVALLFPIISITDDLQESVAVVEESAALRRIAVAAAVQSVPLIANFMARLTALLVPAISLVCIVSEEVFSLPSSPAASVTTLRGPPLAGC
jgi:hypothetical protein